MKRFAMLAAAMAGLVLLALGANRFAAPHSVIHVVTILWKEDSTPEQQQAAIDGVRKMAAEIPGIKNVWTKAIKVQGRGTPGRMASRAGRTIRHSSSSSPIRRPPIAM